MTSSQLLGAHGVCVDTPAGRPLFRDLTLILDRGDRVALVGRNGAGKSTLLEVLAGARDADRGEVRCYGTRALVRQDVDRIDHAGRESPGETRRRRLEAAFDEAPDLLLLDEPTLDLDRSGVKWLVAALRGFRAGLLVVSHDRRLLGELSDFFVVAESGCRHVRGSSEELLQVLHRTHADHERRYLSELVRLDAEERRQYRVRQRRERKKNLGRVRELGRATPRIRLNAKRSYAQEKQGKRALIQRHRLDAARSWVEAARRSLRVELPLEAVIPALPAPGPGPITRLEGVGARSGERVLFEGLTLAVGRERLAVTGENGAGKSSLLELLAGVREPQRGRTRCEPSRIGYIAQNATNFCLHEGVVQHLIHTLHASPETAARCVRAHGFPFALAERPLASLSPGERLRAALVCLMQRPSPPELLILDEPTSHLDFLGQAALERVLRSWPGGLVVASHDDALLSALGLDARVRLGSVASS